MFDLYLITPDREPAQILDVARVLLAAAPAGRVGLQLRSNQLERAVRAELARELAQLARAQSVPLLVSTDLALAQAIAAAGVQLPERGPAPAAARAQLGASALVGASRHDRAGVLAAQRDGASLVTLSPLFAVPGKAAPLGLAAFAEIARASQIPVFALGGINVGRVAQAMAAGAHGVALIREVWDSPQPAAALRAVLAAIDAARAAGP